MDRVETSFITTVSHPRCCGFLLQTPDQEELNEIFIRQQEETSFSQSLTIMEYFKYLPGGTTQRTKEIQEISGVH